MSLPKDFWEQLPLKTDAQLCEMLARDEDYLPEALAAAREELSKRNLAPERVAQIEATVQSEKVAEETKAQERLSWPMRIFVLICGGGLLGPFFAVHYERKGYLRKASDCWVMMTISIAFHLFVGLLYWI